MKELINVVNSLEKRKIAFESLNEKLDTTYATGKLIFNIFSSLAKFEGNLIKERTEAGLITAKNRGRVGGRPKKFNVSRATIYNYLQKN